MGVAELLLKRKHELAAKNLVEGAEYIDRFSKKENVTRLENGIAYEIITQGSGSKPTIDDSVECHYHGTNTKGEVFDSSVERGKTATFAISKVIKGWQEVLPLMNVGSKWVVVIPSEFAYGEDQLSKEIGPNSTLQFEIELIAIK